MSLIMVACAVAALPAVAGFAQAPHSLALTAAARRGHGAARAGGVRVLRADVSVTLKTPLGIVFEEVEPGAAKGLMVAGLVRNRQNTSARNGALVPRLAWHFGHSFLHFSHMRRAAIQLFTNEACYHCHF
jgi:hypothetical protein